MCRGTGQVAERVAELYRAGLWHIAYCDECAEYRPCVETDIEYLCAACYQMLEEPLSEAAE